MSDLTILQEFAARVDEMPDRTALHLLEAGGAAADARLTWAEWDDASRQFAAALIDAGLRPGDCVAILADNDFIWPIADIGTLRAGCASVGIFPSSPPAQIAAVLASCSAKVIVAGSSSQAAAAASAVTSLESGATLVSPNVETCPERNRVEWSDWLERGRALADGADGRVTNGATSGRMAPEDAVALDEVDALEYAVVGDNLAARENAVALDDLAARENAVALDDLAALIYTSGSTGEPKGARLTHRYIVASARSIGEVLELSERDSSLSFLPYSHAAERIFGHYTRICYGMSTGLVPDYTKLWDATQVFRPTIFGGLPRLYEKVVERMHDALSTPEGIRAVALGIERSRLIRAGREVPAALETSWQRDAARIAGEVRALFGGQLRCATSGGAMLVPAVAETLDALGVTVLGAYGMTEHLCVAFNRPERYTFDAVGPAMPGTTIRIATDGEILVRRSALTFDGYQGDAAATAAAFTDDGEWLRTGDIGTLDDDGMLRVTGRSKELIALSTGKKVAPLPIEARLTETPLIGQAVLHGEGRRFISALLTLRRAAVEQWAASKNLAASWPALLEHPDVLAEVGRWVETVNRDLSSPERVRRFVLLDRELSEDNEELTPTLKLRRDVIARQFHDRFDALYAEVR